MVMVPVFCFAFAFEVFDFFVSSSSSFSVMLTFWSCAKSLSALNGPLMTLSPFLRPSMMAVKSFSYGPTRTGVATALLSTTR